MTSKEKKEYLWKEILEKAEISPTSVISLELSDFIDIEANGGVIDDAPVIFSRGDKVLILQKFEKEGLISFLTFDDKNKRAYFFVEAMQTFDFEIDIKEKIKQKNTISIKTVTGILTIDKDTGDVSLDKIKKNLNKTSKTFKVLLKIVESKDHYCSFSDLLNDRVTKDNKRNLSFTIRNIKRYLGILPKKKPKNKDIFLNIKNSGYRILVKNK